MPRPGSDKVVNWATNSGVMESKVHMLSGLLACFFLCVYMWGFFVFVLQGLLGNLNKLNKGLCIYMPMWGTSGIKVRLTCKSRVLVVQEPKAYWKGDDENPWG